MMPWHQPQGQKPPVAYTKFCRHSLSCFDSCTLLCCLGSDFCHSFCRIHLHNVWREPFPGKRITHMFLLLAGLSLQNSFSCSWLLCKHLNSNLNCIVLCCNIFSPYSKSARFFKISLKENLHMCKSGWGFFVQNCASFKITITVVCLLHSLKKIKGLKRLLTFLFTTRLPFVHALPVCFVCA